jgi:hypothetical protein
MMGMHGIGLLFSGFFWIIPVVLGVFIIWKLVRRSDHKNRNEGYNENRRKKGPITSSEKLSDKTIFTLAERNKGILTLSDIVINTGASLTEAEDYMKHLTDGVYVRMNITNNNSIIYEFPELIEK